MVWWKDIDIELEKKSDGDIKDYIDEQAIIQSLRNIFMTIRGSRRRLPTFAINLYSLLFDPIDEITAREIGENIFEAIETWDNRVIMDDLLIKPNPDNHRYDLRLTFRIRGLTSPEPYTIEETIQAA